MTLDDGRTAARYTPPMAKDAGEHEALIEEIQQRVENRRQQGDYPPGLEGQLDRHYHQILSGFDDELEAITSLRLSVAGLRAQADFEVGRIDTWSPNPVKRLIHRLIGRLGVRQAHGVLSQVQAYANALDEVIARLLALVESLAGSGSTGGRDQTDLDKRLHTALDRISLLEERLDARDNDPA